MATSQSLMVWSSEPLSIRVASEEKQTDITAAEWPLNVLMGFSDEISHKLIVLSSEPLIKVFPSGEKQRQYTLLE